MSRIQQTFDLLKKQNRKGLIPFITAGFPEPDLTVSLMHALVEGGADIIELGVPFSMAPLSSMRRKWRLKKA